MNTYEVYYEYEGRITSDWISCDDAKDVINHLPVDSQHEEFILSIDQYIDDEAH